MGNDPLVFSIVVPTYARPKQLVSCLQALARLEYPRDCFEVIAVDDGSKTPLERAVAPFRQQLNLKLLTQPNAGPASARNKGARHANGRFMAFTDDDCTPTPDWLQNLAARFAVTPDHIIGGRTLNTLADNLYSSTSQVMTDAVYAYYNNDPNQKQFFTTNNLSLPADRFNAVGGFDTSFTHAAGEDRDFCDRWQHHGYSMTYAPEVVVYHSHGLTLRSFWKQRFNYGRGAFRFQQVRVQRNCGRVKVDPKFYFHLLRYPFLKSHIRRALSLEALLVASYTAYTAGFLWEKINQINGRLAGKRQQG